jgi:hypothetical protein
VKRSRIDTPAAMKQRDEDIAIRNSRKVALSELLIDPFKHNGERSLEKYLDTQYNDLSTKEYYEGTINIEDGATYVFENSFAAELNWLHAVDDYVIDVSSAEEDDASDDSYTQWNSAQEDDDENTIQLSSGK